MITTRMGPRGKKANPISGMTDWHCLRHLLCILPVILLAGLACLLSGQAAVAAVAGDAPSVHAAASDAQLSPEAVIQQFAGDDEVSPERRIEIERKHQILFIMGLSLLILIVCTVSLGVAMVVFDKDVFVAHMIVAGLSLTLAAAHAATAIAWFWPF